MKETGEAPRIKAKKRGNKIGFWFFKTFMRLFGLRGAYGLLYIVCLHYAIFDRSAVETALAYFERSFPGDSRFMRRLRSYLLFVSQGKQLIDRYAAVSGHRTFHIKLAGHGPFMALVKDYPKGFVLLTAHVGNWQVTMEALKDLGRSVCMLMRPEDNPAVAESLKIGDGGGSFRIISPEQYLGGIVEVMNALEQGHMVAIMGDRGYGFNSHEVTFLGGKAWFPYGAFSIAAAAGCPVVVLLSAKTSHYEYVVDASCVMYPSYESGRDRTRHLRRWVQEFASVLEAYVYQYPYQVFLFHDVWREGKTSDG